MSEHNVGMVQAAKCLQYQVVREAATMWPRPLQVDLRLFDLESGVRFPCDVGYLYANFSLLGLSFLDLGPMYVTDRRQLYIIA